MSPKDDIYISQLIEAAAAQGKKSGFTDQPFPEFTALVHTELSEGMEGYRMGWKPDDFLYSVVSEALVLAARVALGLKDDEPLPKEVNCRVPCSQDTPGAKPEGIPSELADVIIRVCHYAGEHKIDLIRALKEKIAYNATRGFKHGKIC